MLSGEQLIFWLLVLLGIEIVIYFYFWFLAMSNVKKDDSALSFFNFVYLFLPEKFTDAGNGYRKKALVLFLLLVVTILVLFSA